MSDRSRDYCYTVNNYSDEDITQLNALANDALYLVYGKEVAPTTGTTHLQGYVYFKNAKSFERVKKLLPKGAHIEATQGTPEQASAYCKKEGDYQEHGTLPQKQGTRNDLKEVTKLVDEGATMQTIIEVASNYQSLRTAELLFKYREKKRTWKPTVIWIYGSSGTGKTRKAYEMFPDAYRKTNSMGKWFEGYDGHENVLIDDVKDESKDYYLFLLEALDRYEFRVEHKGGSRQFLAKNIVLTSIWSPKGLYAKFLGAKEILRRIDEVIELKDDDEDEIEEETNPPPCPN